MRKRRGPRCTFIGKFTDFFECLVFEAGIIFLYKGWIPGFQNDLSDIQWRMYRASLPALAATLALWVIGSSCMRRSLPNYHGMFVLVSSIALVFILHAWYAVHVLAILMLFYAIGQRTAGRRWVGPITFWMVPGVVWLLARHYEGLPFGMLSPLLVSLDSNTGLVRWHIGFNLIILRMISWAYDLHWTRLRQRGFATGFGSFPTCLN